MLLMLGILSFVAAQERKPVAEGKGRKKVIGEKGTVTGCSVIHL